VQESVKIAARRDNRELNIIPFLQVGACNGLAICQAPAPYHRDKRIQRRYPDMLSRI
jgi:hypothetical protein